VYMCIMVWFMVFNAIFNNISVVSWRSVLLAVTSGEWQIFHNYSGSVLVVIVCLLDLQLLVQSVSITPKVVSSNPVHGEVFSMNTHTNNWK
jgi:hypothetical protein